MFPFGFPPEMCSNCTQIGFKAKTSLYRIDAAATDENRTAVLLQLWDDIIEMYSRGSLTVASDKLIAVSGIINRVSALLGEKNVMGLWEDSMSAGLFWYVPGCGLLSPARPEIWRAPTWSWASVDGSIASRHVPAGNSECTSEYLLDVLKTSPHQHLPRNAANPVISVKVVLKGGLKRIGRLLSEQSPRFRSLYDRARDMGGEQTYQWDDSAWVLSEEACNIGLLFFMPGRIVYNISGREVESLLLRCEDDNAGMFTRIGLHRALDATSVEAVLQEDPDGESLPCLQWDAEKHLHTIFVV